MKLTKQKLKQLIREELSNIVEAQDLQTLAGMKEQLDEATTLLALASGRNPDPDLTEAHRLVNAVAGALALHTQGFGEPEEEPTGDDPSAWSLPRLEHDPLDPNSPLVQTARRTKGTVR